MSQAAQRVLPRWRGFNLTDLTTTNASGKFREDDFRWIADWGFDFLRLPLSYHLWTAPDDPYDVRESVLEEIDRAVELGGKHHLHVCLNFHRAPGFCVNPNPPEPFDLWTDNEALEAFCFHWELFARRYRAIPSDRLSFNLVNEPTSAVKRADHERVMRTAVSHIREIDADRLLIIDGLAWGKEPCPELIDLGVAQSCRAYWPHAVSHYKAKWAGGENLPLPTWPGVLHRGEVWDRAKLEEHYRPWTELARSSVGVHCGEGGCFNQTPRDVFLRWFRDVLDILTSHGIGYALWNFRGAFGIMDSGREDVRYEDWHGHRLDRELLQLLREF